ncbi:right-handed parallel beta-helix repeat-containing protein [Cohnella lupini]|uniref:Parallel beta helix pectate lyase-like protein n=1 Tax=Cohnella lupini TaxID=1294267 RepID=A0A3D9IT17_9BACL|nr:right-handed parallel beta-helix repeat-containing protein [Cohnella lupini]RED64902.1 parallel beta helix pectate lyase-like protein [Cohnella lupini]
MHHIYEYHVAPHGSDLGQGNAGQPFLTIGQAQLAVREGIAGGMTSDVTVYIHGGLYQMESTLRFDERDSGRDGYRVHYRNAPGEKPVLVGGIRLDGWEKHDDYIWKTKLESNRGFQTLYADGARVKKARFPATGYFLTDEVEEGRSAEGIRFRAGDIPEELELQDAQVFVWPGEGEWNWFSETKAVKAMDQNTRTLTFETPATWGIGHGSRYYVQGSLAFLRNPGQFHLDEENGVVYYRPSNDNEVPARQEVIAPTLTRLIELIGSDRDRPVRNLVLEGLTLECTNSDRDYAMMDGNAEKEQHRQAMIYVDHASEIGISGCSITQSGTSGIYLDRHANHIAIDGNLIEHVGYNGIYASGYAAGEGEFTEAAASYTNKGHVITNNRISHGGELIGHGSGILLYQSGDNEISHNLISHMPRYGISIKGLRFGAMPDSLYGIPVTWDNHYDFLHTKNNLIAYNDISHVMLDSQDGGMIEAWGPGRGNAIHGNRLHHSGIHFSFGFGIYLDDAADDFTVTNNILHDLYSTGEGKLWMTIFSKGIGNRIRNNLLVNNPQAISGIGTQEMVGDANKHVIAESNVIYNSGQYLYYFVNWADDRFTAADRNLFWREGEPCKVAGEITPLTPQGEDALERNEYTWEQWRLLLDRKYDGESMVADPLFVDAESGDYRMRANSPAYALGWLDIDFDRIGPRP